jgi:pantetheine-phosphate adenylyltransferase
MPAKDVVFIYAGSFDPPTLGHVNVAERGCCLCDRLIVAVANNTSKKALFSNEERVALLEELFKDNKRISIETFDCLLVDFAQEKNAKALLRGLRTVGDFEFEMAMALANKQLQNMETIFMMTEPEYSFISSTIIKEIVTFGGSVKDMVPPLIDEALKKKFNK